MISTRIAIAILVALSQILTLLVHANFSLPEGAELLTSPRGKRYIMLGANEDNAMIRSQAPQACASIGYGATLAKLEDPSEFDYLATAIKNTAWIESWEGKTYGGACIAFFTGGAIAVPIGNCNSKQAVLCDIDPKMAGLA